MTHWRKRLRWWRLDLELWWLEHWEDIAVLLILATVAYLCAHG